MTSKDAQKRTCLAIVLAAGQSKRMRSDRPKVLHELAGRSLLAHVLASVSAAGAERVALVVGPGHDAVVKEAMTIAPNIDIFVQSLPLGTAHAVLAAKAAIAEGYDDILVAFGDTPLVQPETFTRLRAGLAAPRRAVAALGFLASDPRGYGRLIQEDDTLVAIREDRDLRDGEAESNTLVVSSTGFSVLLSASPSRKSRSSRIATSVSSFLNEAAIAARIQGGKAERRDGTARCREPGAQPRKSLRLHQRRVAKGDENVVITFGDRGLGRKHRMSGAERQRLNEDIDIRRYGHRLLNHGVVARPDDERHALRPGRAHRG